MHFIAQRKKFYLFSSALVILSILAFVFVPKNYGIDMTGGLRISYDTTVPIESGVLEEVRSDIAKNYLFEDTNVLSEVLVYAAQDRTIRVDVGLLKESDIVKSNNRSQDIRTQIPQYFKKHSVAVTESSFIAVGESFGQFVLDRAYLTLIVCLVGIAIYLMIAFRQSIAGTSSFTFAGITILTLLHDVIIGAGIFVLLGVLFPILKIDTFFVAAVLTILGYSINDTIVILDRIRSSYQDRRSGDSRTDQQIFDDSINISVRRSIYTSGAVFMVLICMLFFGPEALVGFVTLMLLGTIFGTYSSIFVAAPLIYDINNMNK